MNSITQRFLECHNKLRQMGKIRSSRQFAISLDYLPQSLSEIFKGRRDVNIELLRKAVEVYQINPLFVLTGEGAMFQDGARNPSMRLLTVVTDSNQEERILHVPVPAQAGYASESGNPVFIRDLPAYTLPDYQYKMGTYRSFEVSGDSMEPTILQGEKVICSYLDPDYWETTVKDNYVYVIVTQNDVLIKRLINDIRNKQRIVLQSDNTFYEPYPLEIDQIREIWCVHSKLSPFHPSQNKSQDFLRDELDELKQTVADQTKLIHRLQFLVEQMLTQKSELPA